MQTCFQDVLFGIVGYKFDEFFLKREKRGLSDKSRDEEDSKKFKERDSLSSLPDSVL